MMLTGLGVTGVIYVLVAITAVALVPVGDLTDTEKGQALTQVVEAGAPGLPFDTIFPFIGMFAVANSALINMLMASRLLYGMANQDVLPRALGKVHPTRRTPWVSIIFTTAIAVGLIVYVVRASATEDGTANVALLGGTTALLLLLVFTVVNIAVLILRKDAGRPRPLQHPDVAAGRGCAHLRVPRRPLGPQRGEPGAVQDRARSPGRRHRAVGDHLVHQPRGALAGDRFPRRRPPRVSARARPGLVAGGWPLVDPHRE